MHQYSQKGRRGGLRSKFSARRRKQIRKGLPGSLRTELGRKLRGIDARGKRLLALSLRRGLLKRRRATPRRDAELGALEVKLLTERLQNEKAKRDCARLEEQIREAPLRDHLLMIPVKDVPLRVSKFDVALREAPLRAVHAMHTILTRMVMFRCLVCNERFPTFHPAYMPPDKLDLHLLKRGAAGVPHCNVEVASWTEMPPFRDEEDGIAKRYTGTCLCCSKDMELQTRRTNLDGEGAVMVPKRSYMNAMDPCWNFPRQLEWLFRQATVTEACLVALDFMQVSFCTVRRTMLHMFKRSTISFPQDTGSFFARMGAMKQFRVDARVNSTRGPGPDARDADRPSRLWADADAEERQRFAKDPQGRMIFAATVVHVRVNGDLEVVYYDGAVERGRGLSGRRT